MIELTEQQVQALGDSDGTPPRVVNPRTKETFVLIRVEEYERLKEEYDDSPWTREELQALAWERVKNEDWDEYDKRPAVVVQADAYATLVSTVVVAEVTKNLAMKNDPACLFIDVNTPDGRATGLLVNSVVSGLVLDTVYSDTVAQVLGRPSPALLQRFNDCLKVGLGLP
jgi:mRNA-degrading endonuclease toxin of MazEF toxin-antitoxin module